MLNLSEDLPHKSGITTSICYECEHFDMSEDLPHKSGITTTLNTNGSVGLCVGRLAPQIGDYDFISSVQLNHLKVGRLAPQIGDYDGCGRKYQQMRLSRKTCPTNRGLRLRRFQHRQLLRRKTCPTNRGLRLKS